MAQRGVKRDKRIAVKVSTIQKLFYEFRTKDFSAATSISAADLSTIGHIALGDEGDNTAIGQGSILLINCNSPRPPRVSKKLARPSGNSQAARRAPNSASTFCAVDKVKAATAAGWRVQDRGLAPGVGSTPKSIITGARLSNGLIYVFPLERASYSIAKEPLGLIDPETINNESERARLIRACTAPRPGKATKNFPDGSTLTTFYSSGAPLTDFRSLYQELLT
jgi:hypothetical protein